MGYSYSRTGGVCCDNCGVSGPGHSVRKRPCTFKITSDNLRTPGGHRHVMSYCSPPALCSACLKKLGGTKGVHAGCAEGAAAMQAQDDANQAKLDAGDKLVTSASGDWAAWVPQGMVGVTFCGAGHSNEESVLMREEDYLMGAFSLAEYRELGVVVELVEA